MANIIEQLEAEHVATLAAQRDLPEFSHGDTVKVWVKIREGDKERLQAYEGVVIARSGGGIMESFTVRKISYGEGVERVFPLYSPNIASASKCSSAVRFVAPSSTTCAIVAVSRHVSLNRPTRAPRRSRPMSAGSPGRQGRS